MAPPSSAPSAASSSPSSSSSSSSSSSLSSSAFAIAAIAAAATAGAAAAAYAAHRAVWTPSGRARSSAVEADGGRALVLRDGRLLEYFEHGAPAATATAVLVALHGAQTTGKLFALLHPWAAQAGVRVVAPTLPGFGFSTYPEGGYALADWVADAEELLRHLGIDRFHVLGTSLGSIHAAALASLHTPAEAVGNVELYVAMAPAAEGHDPLQGSVLDVFGRLRRFPEVKRLFEGLVVLPLMRALVPRDSDVARAIRTQWEGMASCADVIYQPWPFPWTALAQDGRRRVIIVSGLRDTAAPPHNQRRLHAQPGQRPGRVRRRARPQPAPPGPACRARRPVAPTDIHRPIAGGPACIACQRSTEPAYASLRNRIGSCLPLAPPPHSRLPPQPDSRLRPAPPRWSACGSPAPSPRDVPRPIHAAPFSSRWHAVPMKLQWDAVDRHVHAPQGDVAVGYS